MELDNRIHGQDGFSLIEVMIALAILGVVLTGVVKVFTSTGRYHTTQEMMMVVQQDVRAAKNLMVQEIRSAGCNPRGKIRIGFQVGTDAQFVHFTRDIDNNKNDNVVDGDEYYEPDGDVDDSNEDIAYFRTDDDCTPGGTPGAVLNAGDSTPGCLRREASGSGGQAVSPNITDLKFKYYNFAGTQVTPTTEVLLDTIRTVEVTIAGQVQNPNIVSAGNRLWTQTFQVRVRNL